MYTVHIYQTIVHGTLLSGARSSRPGIKRAATSTGYSLNVLDSEVRKFEIVQTGQILTRIDQ